MGFGNESNKWVLWIPQSSSITEASASDCLVSYLGHSLEEAYPSAEMQSVCSATLADWATGHFFGSLNHLQRCSRCILQPQLTEPVYKIDCLIDFNGMSTFLALFYAEILGNHVYCGFTFTFFMQWFLKSFLSSNHF